LSELRRLKTVDNVAMIVGAVIFNLIQKESGQFMSVLSSACMQTISAERYCYGK